MSHLVEDKPVIRGIVLVGYYLDDELVRGGGGGEDGRDTVLEMRGEIFEHGLFERCPEWLRVGVWLVRLRVRGFLQVNQNQVKAVGRVTLTSPR